MSSSPSENILRRRSSRPKSGSFKTPAAAGSLEHKGITPQTIGPPPTNIQKARADAKAKTLSARLKSFPRRPKSGGDIILKLSRDPRDMEPEEIREESNGQVASPQAVDSDDIFSPKVVKESNEVPMFEDVGEVFTTRSRPWLRTRSGSLLISPKGTAPNDAFSPLPPVLFRRKTDETPIKTRKDSTTSRKSTIASRRGSAIQRKIGTVEEVATLMQVEIVKPEAIAIVNPGEVVTAHTGEEEPQEWDEEKRIRHFILKSQAKVLEELKEEKLAPKKKSLRRSLRNTNKKKINYKI